MTEYWNSFPALLSCRVYSLEFYQQNVRHCWWAALAWLMKCKDFGVVILMMAFWDWMIWEVMRYTSVDMLYLMVWYRVVVVSEFFLMNCVWREECAIDWWIVCCYWCDWYYWCCFISDVCMCYCLIEWIGVCAVCGPLCCWLHARAPKKFS